MYEEISGQVVQNEFHKVEINIELLFDIWREIICSVGRGGGGALLLSRMARIVGKEARHTPFCPSREKFHTVVIRGVTNISEAP